MLGKIVRSLFVAILPVVSLQAQDLTGDWQGTLKAAREIRLLLHVTKEGDSSKATLLLIDQTPDRGIGIPVPLSSDDSGIKITIAPLRAAYDGKLSADASSIIGTWSPSGQQVSLPLEFRRSTDETAWRHASPHTVQMVSIDNGVQLEVLDWGGVGRPLVFLAGLGNTAHVFDNFAARFTDAYHVYGITRRGFGASSVPETGYSADHLGDDVLKVVQFLKMDRPVLIGHSVAGEELSSIGTRYPDKIAGLVYLDAGYAYAYYDPSIGDLRIDSLDLQAKLQRLRLQPPDAKQLIQDLLQTTLPRFEQDLKEMQKDLQVAPTPAANAAGTAAQSTVSDAVINGLQKYSSIRVPALSFYAVPHHDLSVLFRNNDVAKAAFEANDADRTEAQAKAFEKGVPSARVIRLSNATHYVFESNEVDVEVAIRVFLNTLR